MKINSQGYIRMKFRNEAWSLREKQPLKVPSLYGQRRRAMGSCKLTRWKLQERGSVERWADYNHHHIKQYLICVIWPSGSNMPDKSLNSFPEKSDKILISAGTQAATWEDKLTSCSIYNFAKLVPVHIPPVKFGASDENMTIYQIEIDDICIHMNSIAIVVKFVIEIVCCFPKRATFL